MPRRLVGPAAFEVGSRRHLPLRFFGVGGAPAPRSGQLPGAACGAGCRPDRIRYIMKKEVPGPLRPPSGCPNGSGNKDPHWGPSWGAVVALPGRVTTLSGRSPLGALASRGGNPRAIAYPRPQVGHAGTNASSFLSPPRGHGLVLCSDRSAAFGLVFVCFCRICFTVPDVPRASL